MGIVQSIALGVCTGGVLYLLWLSHTSRSKLDRERASYLAKLEELSEKNGELKATNRALETQAHSQKYKIDELQSEVRSLQGAQDNLIKAASKLGINLRPALDQTNAFWVSRGLELAEICLKPQITGSSIPDFESAKNDEEMRGFLIQLPGFGSKDDDRIAKDQYDYTQVTAEQFIIREKH